MSVSRITWQDVQQALERPEHARRTDRLPVRVADQAAGEINHQEVFRRG